jgi:hypothetical protein
MAIADLAERLGVRDLSKSHVGRCWEVQIDDQWYVVVNPNRVPTDSTKAKAHEPLTAYVEFNGWPAATLGIDGSGVFVAGEAANEEAFIAACDRFSADAMAAAKEER